MPRNKTREKALPVGLFIILGLVILVGGVLWIRNFLQRPDYQFYVAYKNPSRVTAGVPVYFRGVQVGRVLTVFLDRDHDFAMVEIGITEDRLKIVKGAEITVQTEGITGQRYVNISTDAAEEAELAGVDANYIQDGAIVRGKDNVTWEKIQEQLARIAEDRTLEKILVKTDETLSELAVAAEEIKQLSHNVNRFVASNQGEAREAIVQFNRTAAATELAMRDFGVASRETMLAVRNISGQMEGLDKAFASIEQAGRSVSETVSGVGMQLENSEILPRLSEAATAISVGVSGIQEDFATTTQEIRGTTSVMRGAAHGMQTTLTGHSPEVTNLNNLLFALEESGEKLETNLRELSRRNEDPVLESTYARLHTLATSIQEAAEAGQIDLRAESDPARVRAQLELVENIGNRLVMAANQLRPVLRQRLETLPKDTAHRTETRNLLETVNNLALIGQGLSDRADELQPRVNELVTAVSARERHVGGIAATILQIRQAAARFDCVAQQISDILDERFLGFKLFFGNPGSDYRCGEREFVEGL